MSRKQKIQIIIGCLLLCLVPVLNTNAQWIKSTSAVNPNGVLAYPHPSAAYCSHSGNNGGGELYKSADSGANWQLIHDFGSFTATEHMLFLNADTGFVQQFFTTYRTFDGGQNWQQLPDLFGPSFVQSFMRTLKNSGDTLYITGARGDTSFVFQSLDYGSTFNIIYQKIEPNARPLYVSYYTSKDAYIIHPKNDSTTFVTHDNFATFDTLEYYNAYLGNERIMAFLDSSHGFFYGNGGALSYPTRLTRYPNGIRMDQTYLDATGILPVWDMELGLEKLNNRVYACSEYGKIFWSADLGVSWNEQITPVSSTLSSIAFANENLGIAVSAEGIIYTKNGGDAPNGISNQILRDAIDIYPNPATNRIYIKDYGNNIIIGLSVINNSGQQMLKLAANSKSFSVLNLASGHYQIIFETKNGDWFSKPFVKN